MDNYTQLANKILNESMDSSRLSSDTALRDEMLALDDELFSAIDAGDKAAHVKVLNRYDALRTQAIDKFGIDGPVHLIDPDLHGAHSDDYKDENGVRPHNVTFRDAVEFYPSGAYGKIVDGKFIAPPVKSYIEDNESATNALQDILQKYPSEIEDLKNGGDIADDMYQELYEYFLDSGEMPYGTAKARDGDPYEWIFNKLDELGVFGEIEDNESTINADDLKTIEAAKSLAGGKAEGGMFSNPEKAIQRAYGKMLTKVSKQIQQVAKKV
jgi:hypothetical protein